MAKKVDIASIMARVRPKAKVDVAKIMSNFKPSSWTMDFDDEVPGVDYNQRWYRHRDFYLSNQEDRFDPTNWRVDAMVGKKREKGMFPSGVGILNTWQDGFGLVLDNHYAASLPQVRVMVGLFRARDAKLCGVAFFSNVKKAQQDKYGKLGADELVELSRFILLQEVPYGAEVWFLARAMAIAREIESHRHGGIKAVLSFSDPIPRRALSGQLTMPGHIGNIYQAHNALFLGRAKSKTMHLDPRGVALEPRMVSKIKQLDVPKPKGAEAIKKWMEKRRGGESGVARVKSLGVAGRKRGESHATWINRVMASGLFRKIPHSGNLVYLWTLGDKRTRRAVKAKLPSDLPYPKTLRQRYLNALNKFERYMSAGKVEKAAATAGSVLEAWTAMDADDQGASPQPPQFAVTCGVGSRNRSGGLTAGQILERAIC